MLAGKGATVPVTDYAVSCTTTWQDGAGTQYVGLQGQFCPDTDIANVRQMMSRDGTVRYLRIRVVSSSTSGSVTATLMKNGSATDLTKSISAGTSSLTVEEDETEVEFYDEDLLAWRIELPGSGESSTTLQWIACEIGEPSE